MKPTLVCTEKKRNHIGMFQCRKPPKKKTPKTQKKKIFLKKQIQEAKRKKPNKEFELKIDKNKRDPL